MKHILLLLLLLSIFSCRKNDTEDCTITTKNQVNLKGEIVNPSMKFCGRKVSIESSASNINKRLNELLSDDKTMIAIDKENGLLRIDDSLDYLNENCLGEDLDIEVNFYTGNPGNYALIKDISNKKNKFEVTLNNYVTLDSLGVKANTLEQTYFLQFTTEDNKVLYLPISCEKDYYKKVTPMLVNLKMLYGTNDYNTTLKFKGTIRGGHMSDFE